MGALKNIEKAVFFIPFPTLGDPGRFLGTPWELPRSLWLVLGGGPANALARPGGALRTLWRPQEAPWGVPGVPGVSLESMGVPLGPFLNHVPPHVPPHVTPMCALDVDDSL